jgi:polysaccharide export outer membrane protein
MLLAILVLTGCVSRGAPNYKATKTNIPIEKLEASSSFHLSAGDRLTLKFFYNPELNEESLIILPDGTISLQLVGIIVAKGKSIDELTNEIKQAYRSMISLPEITIQATTLRERMVFVGGEVNRPGQYQDKNGLNPLQAVFLAGGLRNSASIGNILILRKTKDQKLGYYIYDLRESFSKLDEFDNFRLRDSDIVYVSRSQIGNVNEFVNQYVSGLIPSWFQVFVTDEINSSSRP